MKIHSVVFEFFVSRQTDRSGGELCFIIYIYIYIYTVIHCNFSVFPGIIGRIETYINKHNLLRDHNPEYKPFPIKKLFILIPKDLYTPTDLKEVSTDDPNDLSKCWMEAAPVCIMMKYSLIENIL